jgi:mitogen-activated protein kinase 1/3
VLEEDGENSIYVVTRWYRPPEILLNCRDYDGAVDVWLVDFRCIRYYFYYIIIRCHLCLPTPTEHRAVGCILGELLLRKALFPGDDYMSQLKLIHNLVGTQAPTDLDFITAERAKKFMLGLPRRAPTPMPSAVPACRGDPDLLDMMQRLLTFQPARRITVQEALEHPFLAANRVPESEVTAQFTFEDDFGFESEDPDSLDKDRLQTLMWEQMRLLHPYISPRHP